MSAEETGTRFAFYSSLVLYPCSHLHLTTIQLTLREIWMVRTYKYTDVDRPWIKAELFEPLCWPKGFLREVTKAVVFVVALLQMISEDVIFEVTGKFRRPVTVPEWKFIPSSHTIERKAKWSLQNQFGLHWIHFVPNVAVMVDRWLSPLLCTCVFLLHKRTPHFLQVYKLRYVSSLTRIRAGVAVISGSLYGDFRIFSKEGSGISRLLCDIRKSYSSSNFLGYYDTADDGNYRICDHHILQRFN